MKKFQPFALQMILWGFMAGLLVLSSCKDDEDPVFTEPTITVTPATPSQAPGQKVTFTIAVAAEGGLASVKLDNTDIKTYSADADTKADVISYEYTVPSTATANLTLNFVVTDKQSTPKTATAAIPLTLSTETVTVNAALTGTVNWVATKKYLLVGNIYVQSGAELNIEPGTVILGDKVSKGALIVSRGAKIHAKGTAAKPIIFTSNAPKGFRNYGDWGGVVLLGKAKNNQNDNQTIEGISAATGDNGLYGGSADDDSSGEFYYARIEFAGIALSTDNELNGLTMGSVGSNTQVHHIQVSYSGDDSYEWFGGKVSTTYLVAYRGWDDEFDTDFGHTGKHQFLASFRDPNIADKSGSNGFESDNDNTTTKLETPLTAAVFSNVTLFGPYVYAALSNGALSGNAASANYTNGAHIRRNTALQVYNTVFVGWGRSNGVNFEGANTAAVFKSNYFGRTVGNLKSTSGSFGYSDANFATDNPLIEATQSTVDLSAKFAGLTGAMDITKPSALLASGSALLTGALDVSVSTIGLTKTDYVGAFNAADNWMTGWTNFDPQNTNY